MKMEDRALEHIMQIQTQMLQHITKLQEDQKNLTMSNSQVTMQQSISSPTTPPEISNGEPFPYSMSINDPTKYGSHAAPYIGDDRNKAASFGGGISGFIGGSIATMRDYDPTGQSKEATAADFSAQTREFQEGVTNFIGGAAGGATTAGSFFIPGILPSLVVGGAAAATVGGAAKAISDETTLALDYQEMLQKDGYKFINAFESTDEMGGIGMGLEDRQELSKYLRDLAPEKFLEDEELQRILEGATNNNLLKTVSDVKSFKDKFSEVVDAVKEITVTMNQTLEEATAFMGDMESRGISTKDMPFVAAQSKVMASMLGIEAEEGSQILMQASDNIVAGTSLDPTKIMQSSSQSVFNAQQLQDWAKENDEDLYHTIKNMGGAGNVGVAMEQAGRNFARSDKGVETLLGMYAAAFEKNEDGSFEINRDMMNQLTSGEISVEQMQSMSRQSLSELSTPEKRRLQGTIGVEFSDYATGQDLASFMRRDAEMIIERQARAGHEIDMETALVEAGIASDYEQADLFKNMINASEDEDNAKIYTARVLKEEQDSNAISNSPSMFKQAGFWWERNVTNNIGDIGQSISDAIGSGLQDYQKFITGIDDRSMVGGAQLPSFADDSGINQMLDSLESLNQNSEAMTKYLRKTGGESLSEGNILDSIQTMKTAETVEDSIIDVDELRSQLTFDNGTKMDAGMYNYYNSKVKEGTMTATELAKISERADEGELGVVGGMRADIIQKRAAGEYDGFLGAMDLGIDNVLTTGAGAGKGIWDATAGGVFEKSGGFDVEDDQLAELKESDEKGDLGTINSMRLGMTEKKEDGKYKGFKGGLRKGFDHTALFGANVGAAIWEDTGGSIIGTFTGNGPVQKSQSKDTLDSLEEQQEELADIRTDLNKEVNVLYQQGKLDLDEEGLMKLEDAIKAGDVDTAQGLTSNETAINLAKDYQELVERETAYGEDMGAVNEVTRYTKGLATAGTQLGDLLAASGLYTEAQIDDLVGDLRKSGKKTNKKLKKGKLSLEEMLQASDKSRDQIDVLFSQLPQNDMAQLAEYLTTKDPSLQIEDFYGENSQTIDSDLLKSYIMDDVIRNQHASTDDVEGKGKGGGDAKEAAENHQAAMAEFLTAFQEESQMLRDVVMGRPVTSSSLGAR